MIPGLSIPGAPSDPGAGEVEVRDFCSALSRMENELIARVLHLRRSTAQVSESWSGSAQEAWAASAATVDKELTATVMRMQSLGRMLKRYEVELTRIMTAAVSLRRTIADSQLDASQVVAVQDAQARLDTLAEQRKAADSAVIAAITAELPASWPTTRTSLSRIGVKRASDFGTSLADDLGALARRIADGHRPTDAELRALADLLAADLDDSLTKDVIEELSSAELEALALALDGIVVSPGDATNAATALLGILLAMPPAHASALRGKHPQLVDDLIVFPDSWKFSDDERSRLTLRRIEAWQDTVTRLWSTQSAGQRDAMLTAMPLLVGNLNGIPFATRYAANQVALRAETERLTADSASLATKLAHTTDAAERSKLQAGIDANAKHLAAYRSSTGDDIQILVFDPRGDGKYARVYGDLATAARVGTTIGGTTSNMMTNLEMADQWASDFWNAESRNGLATISWMGTDMPDEILPATDMNLALRGGAALSAFSVALDRELTRSAADGPRVTIVGHSYAGALLGRAEVIGVRADAVVYVESAGAGTGVSSPTAYADPGKERYALMAPGDPMGDFDGSIYIGGFLGPILSPHGEAPTELPGVTVLETGSLADGTPLTGDALGSDVHNKVLDRYSDSWKNVLAVIMGDTDKLVKKK
ncbi:alpha/beta hydrolase [Leifsonia sp. NPDC058292]|uniref:alpha/beta hydrolase n=1 Tax=Leifsonia sp. NPDC058292 TaxID=3346428 RepID=UPI0036DE26E3